MSGSRVDIPDKELAQEWPFLTRQQLEEYKDAFRIFDRSGTGSFTAEDIGWVMRSLGQNPTQQQIDAIIRDMDLDNDGVIDLAEFMIRMMALTTKTAAEEDLKHVFDVLDKSGEGMINADSLRSAIKNIAEWEMTDDDIEVAIKLADKSGDGRIDYDEFIAFVFGDDEPVQRLQQAGPSSMLHGPESLQQQAEPVNAQAVAADSMPPGQQSATEAVQRATEATALSSNSWPDQQEPPSAFQLPEAQLPPSAADPMQAAVISARQQSLTDAWVAAQAAEVASASADPLQASLQAGSVYENALYQDDAPCAPQAGAARHVPLWELQDETAGPDSAAQQPGDDVRLDIQADDASSAEGHSPIEPETQAAWSQQAGNAAPTYSEGNPATEQTAALHEAYWPQQLQQNSESLQRFDRTAAASEQTRVSQTSSNEKPGSELQATQAGHHGNAMHLALPSELHEDTAGPTSTSAALPATTEQMQQHATRGKKGTNSKSPTAKAPRQLPALSYVQLSQGVNRSQVKQQQLHKQT